VTQATAPIAKWEHVEAVLKGLGATRTHYNDVESRSYEIGLGCRGSGFEHDLLIVNVRLNRRWSQVDVDRICTSPVPVDEAAVFYREMIHPFVETARRAMAPAVRYKRLADRPQAGHVWMRAKPVKREDVPDLLAVWVQQELAWCKPSGLGAA
jgi:hypothetical protein